MRTMSYPKKLLLLGLPVMFVAVYLLQGWSVFNEIPSFNPVKPSESAEAGQQYREEPSSKHIPRGPTIDEDGTNEQTTENLSQDGDHVFVERSTSTQTFEITTEITTHINDAHRRRTSTQAFASTTERDSTADQTVEYTVAQSALCDKPPRDAGIDELLRRYRECMGRLVDLALQDGNGKLSPTPSDEQTSYEGLGMLSGDGWRQMAGRLATVKKGCRTPAVEFTGAPNLSDVVFDRTHHLAYCRHGKAATSSLLSFMLLLNHVGPTPLNLNGLHNKIFKHLPKPTQESQRDLLKRSFVFTAVRHPFRRLVSAYCSKEVERRLKVLPYEIRMKSPKERELELLEYNYKVKSGTREPTVMAGPWIRRAVTDQSLPGEGQKDGSLLAHYLSAVDFNSTLKGKLIKPTTDLPGVLPEGGRHQSTQKLPSVEPFRMFVHGVVLNLLNCSSDTSCLALVDRHIRPQVIRWNPCVLNFDMVMKVETLDQDISLLKDLLGLPDPGQIQKKPRSRRAVTQSDDDDDDDDAGLEKKASVETIENQVGTRSIVGNTDTTTVSGNTDTTTDSGNTDTTTDSGNTDTTTDSGGHDELSEEKVSKITPEAKSDSGFFKLNKSGRKCGTYEEYMSQLSQRDIDLLYTCYYWDFKVFGYEPFD